MGTTISEIMMSDNDSGASEAGGITVPEVPSAAEYNANWLGEAGDVSVAPGTSQAAGLTANWLGSQSQIRTRSQTQAPRKCTKILEHEDCTIKVSEDILPRCPKCLSMGRSYTFTSAKELDIHCSAAHPELRIQWQCAPCLKTFVKVHGWIVHKSKCKGPQPAVTLAHQCTECSLSFSSKIGLSQHERHQHPMLRNRKRIQEMTSTARDKTNKPTTLWSEDEIKILQELDSKYKDDPTVKHINKLIAQHLPGKTMKQISDKRRGLIRGVDYVDNGSQTHSPQQSDEALERQFSEAWAATGAPISPERMQGSRQADVDVLYKAALQDAISSIECPAAWAAALVNIKEVAGSNEHLGETMDAILGEVTSKLLASKPTEGSRRGDPRNGRSESVRERNNGRPLGERAKLRQSQFVKCLNLYEKCPKRLADMIVSNDLTLFEAALPPPKADVERLYGELWSQPGPELGELYANQQAVNTVGIKDVFRPFTATDVSLRMSKIASSSAPGLDGIKKKHLGVAGTSAILAAYFNLLILKNYYPTMWRRNRTVLIPKPGKDKKDVKNWRPLTISSLLARIFSGLMDARLRSFVVQHPRQKGFAPVNGCFANITAFDAAIEAAKMNSGVCIVTDIEKAFDTVPHTAIKLALLRKGLPSPVVSYICNMQTNCTTVIKTKDGDAAIEMRRGVKQGDPLSPLLFNLCIEPLLAMLNDTTEGIEVGTVKISALAFADDLVTLAADKTTAQRQLELIDSYLSKMGMKLAVSKCSAFHIEAGNKTWCIKNPELKLGDECVRAVQPGEAFSYLGTKMGPWQGLLSGFEHQAFEDMIRRLRKLPLRPMQKIEMLRTYLIPRYMYCLIVKPPCLGVLRMIDTTIRTQVKEILHISQSVTTNFLYTPTKSGGLGMHEIEKQVLIAALRNGLKALACTDHVMLEVMQRESVEKNLKKYAAALRLNWPVSLDDVDRHKARLKKNRLTEWAKDPAQGQGVMEFQDDPISNVWLRRRNMLLPSRIADAIRLRTNTAGNRTTLSRFTPNQDTTCRRCGEGRETLGHILGLCIATKCSRIQRHNEIKNLISDRLSTKYEVIDEPTFRCATEMFKPDLVVNANEEGALILDVTVRYEKGHFLKQAHNEKVEKYARIMPVVRETLNVSKARVVPIVVGSRGALPATTKRELTKLGIQRKDWITISMIALRSSIEMYNKFIDYGNT